MTNETLTFQIPDTPGELAKVTNYLTDNGINIVAITADNGNVCLTTDNNDKAVTCLNDNGYNVTPMTTFTVNLPNEPGQLYTVCNELGNAGVNINTIFGDTTGGTGNLTFVVDNIEVATPIFEKFGIVTVPS